MTVEETKSGISRRDLIKKGAVAGAVFWSVPVIESVTSRAAAGSLTTGPIGCSWTYVIWKYQGGTTLYVSGYSNAGSTNDCTSFANTANHPTGGNGSGNGGNVATGNPETCFGTSYGMVDNASGPAAVTVNGAGLVSAGPPPVYSTTADSSCTALTQSGNTITASSNVIILAYFYYGGNTGFVGACGPSSGGQPVAGATIGLPGLC